MPFKQPTKKDPSPTKIWLKEAMNDKYSDTENVERRLQEVFLVGAEPVKRRDKDNNEL